MIKRKTAENSRIRLIFSGFNEGEAMQKDCDIGVMGLGVMGAALAKNMMNKRFKTALYSVAEKEREAFNSLEYQGTVASDLEGFVSMLSLPRRIFLMITAGEAVDQVLARLLPLLSPGDIVMDGGNSHYRDTERRSISCGKAGIHFMGIGVSGGEQGALHGPSIMAGGSLQGWQQSEHILKSIAAVSAGGPCCRYIGSGGAGHYVKMVHNGIEYAILEILAETYHFLRYAKGLKPEQISELFETWEQGRLSSYLMEISVRVLNKKDEDGGLLLDRILDVAEQKGTGKWTVQDALERGVYIPTIYEAQAVRAFSANQKEREAGRERLSCHPLEISEVSVDEMEQAVRLAIIISYSQGLALIAAASRDEGWGINLPELIGTWKNGCIIRSRLLEEIEQVDSLDELPLLLAERMSEANGLEKALRKLVSAAAACGSVAPGFASALGYYDLYRAKLLPVSFIQALRDCFGAHTYRRTDQEGAFHSEW